MLKEWRQIIWAILCASAGKQGSNRHVLACMSSPGSLCDTEHTLTSTWQPPAPHLHIPYLLSHRRIADVCFELHFRVTPGQFRSAAASSLHRRLAHSHSQLVSPFVCVPGSAPLLAQQGEVHKQISGGWNTMARSNAKKVLTQPTEGW